MNKVKLLTIIAIGLLITNIALVAFVLLRDYDPHRLDRKKIISENLNFNTEQIKQYEVLIQFHRKAINESEKQIRDFKIQLYYTISNNASQKTKDSLFLELNKIENKIEHIHYSHFQAIRELCKNDQKILFENFTKDFVKLFGPPSKNKRDKDKSIGNGNEK